MSHGRCDLESCTCRCAGCECSRFIRELRQAQALTAYTAAKGDREVPTPKRLQAAMEAIGVTP